MQKEIVFSLVTTVLNDVKGTEVFLERMAEQTVQPDEIVIVDGGSTDGTWELLQHASQSSSSGIPILVHQEPGCNVARGRDLAIEQSRGRNIVSTDVGCEWDREWFAELIEPIKNDPQIDVVVGSWAVRVEDAKSPWALVEFARRWPFRLEAAPESLSINRAIVYKRHVWKEVGGYPQDLTLAADDVVFDMLIRKPEFGFRFAAAPKVRCYWERHEKLKQFCKEERRNFYGAGEAQIWGRHFILVGGRMLAEVLLLAIGVLTLLFSQHIAIGVVLIGLCGVSIGLRIRNLWPAVKRLRSLSVGFPLLRTIWFEYCTKAWGLWGYAKGWLNGASQCGQTRERLWGGRV